MIDELIAQLHCDPAQACEYLHGADEVIRLANSEDRIGLLLPAIKRAALFDYVAEHGVMPRKSFSLGAAQEKRYYCECRKIVSEVVFPVINTSGLFRT
ncbi:hypothetical protein RQN30_12220 [Arcanobacterium hippocoleae]